MLGPFREVWAADFEFVAHPGERPDVVCLVARELKSGRVIQLWRDQLGPVPPYATGPDTLLVAYYASAELGCHRALGWPTPARVLDLFTEFRARTQWARHRCGQQLVGSADPLRSRRHRRHRKRGNAGIDPERRPVVRAASRPTFSTYCESDVLRARTPARRPCCRGSICRERCCAGATWRRRRRWSTTACRSTSDMLDIAARRTGCDIQDQLIADIDCRYGVFDGRTFKADRFEWLAGSPTVSPGRGWRAAGWT